MKELLFQTLRHEETTRAPWVPFAGVHAAKLKGYTATEMLTDADKAVESLMMVNQLYKPDGQPMIFDLQIEAECLGCELTWADDCPPSVSSHPLAGEMDDPPVIPYDCTIPTKESGRIPYVLDVMTRMKKAVGDTIDMVEYKFIYKENVARCVKMGVPNLPSMYINGELKYRSIIPTKAELEQAIQEAFAACTA